MTIAIGWTRRLKEYEELIFVSDSRLSGDGRTFDGCPKLFALPRNDCAIAFTGYTGHGFPMALQLRQAIESYEPAQRRSMDITTLKSHCLKIFDRMASLIQSSELVSVEQNSDPEANFIFGGYCWITKSFKLWSIRYRPKEKRFVADPAKSIRYIQEAQRFALSAANPSKRSDRIGQLVIAGDEPAVKKSKELLLSKLEAKYRKRRLQGLDMEPFEVVRDMLRDSKHAETIGGAPQIIKVYQYLQTGTFVIYWPDKKSGILHLQGRPCLAYERVDKLALDPDTLISEPILRPASTTAPQDPDLDI